MLKSKINKIYKEFKIFEIASCRYGIEIALRATAVNEKTEKPCAIVQAFTCQVVENAVLCAGWDLEYVDIDLRDYSMNSTSIIDKLLSLENGSSCKAVILQHTYGITPIDRKKIMNICNLKNIRIIEDIAHVSITNHYQVKELQNSECFIASFQASKATSAFQGGILAIRKTSMELLKEVDSILHIERQSIEIGLTTCQVVDSFCQAINHPYSSLRFIRNKMGLLYKGMEDYEKKLDIRKVKADKSRRGRANIITRILIYLAIRRGIAQEKKKIDLQEYLKDAMPLNIHISEQIKNGNTLLMWPITKESASLLKDTIGAAAIMPWFNPKIFPSTRYEKYLRSNNFRNSDLAEKELSQCINLNLSKAQYRKVVRMLKEY